MGEERCAQAVEERESEGAYVDLPPPHPTPAPSLHDRPPPDNASNVSLLSARHSWLASQLLQCSMCQPPTRPWRAQIDYLTQDNGRRTLLLGPSLFAVVPILASSMAMWPSPKSGADTSTPALSNTACCVSLWQGRLLVRARPWKAGDSLTTPMP